MKTPMPTTVFTVLLLASPVLVSPAVAALSDDGAFGQVMEHYEAVWLALANDGIDGVAQRAEQIETIVNRLARDWSPAAAGVSTESTEELMSLLPKLASASAALSAATSLDAARDAFYDLSKPLVRWRKAADGEPVVAFCTMAKRSWLQPEGELANPYYGKSMPRCGDVVDG